MTDIISAQELSEHELSEPETVALIELLFFAYRDFVSDPDEILAEFGFGRAHHRVVHFVGRDPGMTVQQLLDILRITKQSLARVLKQLIDGGFISQRTGETDRRQRLLYTTDKGKTLAKQLVDMQARRLRNALDAMPANCRSSAAIFLRGIMDAAEQDKVAHLIAEFAERS